MTSRSILNIFILVSMILASCKGNKTSEDGSIDKSIYLKKGAEISGTSQSALLKHLSAAMEEGEAAYAVQFCNLRAIEVIDSISKLNDCLVSRISDRNRNPDNELDTETDKNIWDYYKSAATAVTLSDTVLQAEGRMVYYRPIKIGMPTCLKCHGKPGVDIDDVTLAVIDSLYPNDLAKNYESGDLRGLWKIEFN